MAEDFGTLFRLMKKPLCDPYGVMSTDVDIMSSAYDKTWIGSIPRARIEELREAHKVRSTPPRPLYCDRVYKIM